MYKVYPLEFWLFLANISNTISKPKKWVFQASGSSRITSAHHLNHQHHYWSPRDDVQYISADLSLKKKHFDINHCQDYSMYSVTKSWIGRGMQKPEHQSFAYRVKNKSAQKTSKQILYDTFPLKCFLRLFTLCLRCLKTLNQNNDKSKCTKTKPGKWI